MKNIDPIKVLIMTSAFLLITSVLGLATYTLPNSVASGMAFSGGMSGLAAALLGNSSLSNSDWK